MASRAAPVVLAGVAMWQVAAGETRAGAAAMPRLRAKAGAVAPVLEPDSWAAVTPRI